MAFRQIKKNNKTKIFSLVRRTYYSTDEVRNDDRIT